ncbi:MULTISPECIES: L-lactate permease [unclassified Bradyrhizobium]|uniref:L-lactate permease n=1 Tax=unclassified Bradyrhizobium TaxID=2631580 RepID=UPI0029167DA4|nr:MULTISPECIES: L-lactate permease [unclassified Bradyrhizobium]
MSDYLLWSLPFVGVALLIASGRASSVTAGLFGLIAAITVALTSAPNPFGPHEAVLGLARGGWLALFVGSVILGGLFFRDIVSGQAVAAEVVPVHPKQRRKQLYATCFLIGPFAEAATGFGVGQVTIAPMLKAIGLAPIYAVLLGLFSQIMVPWGALANGTIVGSQLAGVSPNDLGVHSALLTVPLLIAWLAIFWRIAAAADVPGTVADFSAEIICTLAAAALLVVSNVMFGPEVSGLAALGPLIAMRFLTGGQSDRRKSAIRVGLPYAALIAILIATRAIAPVNRLLGEVVAIRPFADGPTWFPLLHPSTWLLVTGFATAFAIGHPASLADAMKRAWSRGRKPILAIALFLAMAQVMTMSGMAGGLAKGLRLSLGPFAALATPLLGGLFGFITSSSSATNGLLMPSQAALAAEADLSLPWLVALQNTAAAAATMLSPVRMAVGCALVGKPDLERTIYSRAWPLGAIPSAILVAASILLLV